LENFEYEVEYGDSQCSKTSMLTAVDLYYKNQHKSKLTLVIEKMAVRSQAAEIAHFLCYLNKRS
jgi:hypothetical protein